MRQAPRSGPAGAARSASRGAALAAAALSAALAAGCATTSQGQDAGQGRSGPGQRLDPWENWNRKVFAFNESLDKHVLKPVATAYADVVPRPVRRSVDNFFNNAADAWSAVNALLQGKGRAAFDNVVRVTTNSFFGIGGLIDVASELGIERHNEDFGQTLGRWGFGAGAYIVWPVFGPSTVRDSIALPLDRAASPALIINDGQTQVGLTTLQLINARANLLGASQVLEDIALDKYTFLRDAYLQRRRSLIRDGADESSSPDDDDPDAGERPADFGPAPGAPASATSAASAPARPASAAQTAPAASAASAASAAH
jgi:phospholipid-binding lipoprotein MlaA